MVRTSAGLAGHNCLKTYVLALRTHNADEPSQVTPLYETQNKEVITPPSISLLETAETLWRATYAVRNMVIK